MNNIMFIIMKINLQISIKKKRSRVGRTILHNRKRVKLVLLATITSNGNKISSKKYVYFCTRLCQITSSQYIRILASSCSNHQVMTQCCAYRFHFFTISDFTQITSIARKNKIANRKCAACH